MSDRLPVQMAATGCGWSAKAGSLSLHQVVNLQVLAEETMDRAEPLRRAVLTFVTMYELHHRDAAALAALGDDLLRAVDLSLVPVPPDLDRRDIHG